MIIQVGPADAVAVRAEFAGGVAHFWLMDTLDARLLLAAAVPGREARVIFGDERDCTLSVAGVSTDEGVLTLVAED